MAAGNDTYTVLIIDNDAGDVAVLKSFLEDLGDIGAHCVCCDDVEECARVLTGGSVDLVFISYCLDAASGFSFIKNIREINRDIPMIVLTQSGDERITAQIVRWGAVDYLPKNELSSIRVRRTVEQAVGAIKARREEKLAATLLRLNEHNYRSLIDTIPDIVLVHRAGTILFVNQAIQSMLGYTEDQALGRSIFEFIATDEHRRKVIESMSRRSTGEDVPEYEIDILDSKGNVRNVIVRASLTMFNDEPAFQVVLIDITERKRIEEDVLRARKLESLGLLAGGIAHDFNNILTGIISGIAAAKTEAHPGSELHRVLDEIERASFKASELTRELLTFSHGGEPVREVCSVHLLVKQALLFTFPGDNIDYSLRLQENLLNVVADSNQICQVLCNLLLNASQAMQTGGTVVITGANVAMGTAQKPQEIGIADVDDTLPLGDGLYVKLAVSDSGMGIPKENLQKIFDPYFTTKPAGTGLGLATVFSIVQRHNGCITVDSQVGTGSTFTLYLPATLDACEGKRAEARIARTTGGRVMVMDDDQTILYTLEKFLTAIGYTVTSVKDGAAALDAYREGRDAGRPFAAVLMDLTIPGGMGGKEAVGRLLAYDPGAKVVVISGYSDDPVLANYRRYGFVASLSKPFKPRELDRILKEIATGAR